MIRLYLASGILAAFAASAGFGYVQTQRLQSTKAELTMIKAKLATCQFTETLRRKARNATDDELIDGLSRP